MAVFTSLVDAATSSVTYAGDNGRPVTVLSGMSVASWREQENLLLHEQEHEHQHQ
ncbi:hypothetical protein FOQG_10587 [Fusarium oxysporum f. sp. raphani 54005]|uniref:Uncharacterized protein n=2 Tax=Fusarium oxysporum TaxID=5507 RepID=X0C2W6_FUSOX|nr:hypothetical protein FOVG_11508 [Fusarium oxysporum f. sp. pisi HDV247]EXK85513.1 hypothetical protein FOQG_10587 [Fusarium oxysporum f. sp. raphani 54005]